jgi:hypothetical protein
MGYPFEYVDNRIVADIRGKRCLIDTGAPFSLGHNVFDFLQDTFDGGDLQSISEHLGAPLDMLMGGNILSAFDGFFVWTEKQEIHFNNLASEGIVAVPMELRMNIPIISLSLHGQTVQAMIDSGSKQSFVKSEFVEGVPFDGEFVDFYPGFGSIVAPLVSLKYKEIGGVEEKNFKFAVMPKETAQVFEDTGLFAMLGVDWLRNGKDHFQINYRDKNFSNS